jgi:hypothetical protein
MFCGAAAAATGVGILTLGVLPLAILIVVLTIVAVLPSTTPGVTRQRAAWGHDRPRK